MARFLTPQWVEELNAALAGVAPLDPLPDGGMPTAEGPITVVQEIHGAPGGDVRLVLRTDAGTVHLSLGDEPGGGPIGAPAPTVTIVVSYEDASAMAQGALTPAQALNDGRIRVRGDMAALVASQQVLHDARARLGTRGPSTVY